MRLSVLDQSIAVAGRPQDESIRNTVALAKHCEALGYERFWVSEHHNHPTIVGTAPEIVIAAIAATTQRIRVGSAGIMLPHYSPFKVAAVKAFPQAETTPEVWILGSSDYGAQVAAIFGLPYCFAWFFSDGQGGKRAIDLYRSTYRPSLRHPEPHAALCVWALAGETMEQAQYHFTSRALSRINRDKGILLPLEAPDIAAA